MGTVDNPISTIFFEKQEARLCAQHALNMLLQQALFSPVDLAEIAHRLDRDENAVLEAGHKESQNMDDSGFFSVQVISEALKTFHIEIISILHPEVAKIKENPLTAKAFICNRSEHWFVVRKFGQQWFELNSVRTGAVLHTDTYVSLFLNQLTADGYSIFVVNGILPDCEADHVIAANPVKFAPPKRKTSDEKKEDVKEVKAFTGSGQRLGGPPGDAPDDDELAEAIRRSLEDQAGPSHSGAGGGKAARSSSYDDDLRRAMEMSTADDSEDRSFQMALALSMEAGGTSSTASTATTTAPLSAIDDSRAKREAFLKRFD